MTAAEIAARTGGEVVTGDRGAAVSSWAFDSRALSPGACFVALVGHRDGHDFVTDAFHAGASVALVSRPVAAAEHTVVRVDDTVVALQAVARAVRRDRTATRVVGVAGSTGKTSTKDLLAGALASRSVHANPESYNNEFGLPVTLLNAPSFAEAVVTEMGERFPGDIALLCDIARPDIGVVTNVGLAHAEHLGGHEGAAAAIGELLDALPADGLAVLNADDEFTPALAARTVARVLTVGTEPAADLRVTDTVVGRDLRSSFVLDGQPFEVPLRGAHQIANAALAAAVARHGFDIPWDAVAAGIRDARASRWRMEVVERPDGVAILNDAYNANPDSMAAALRALAHVPAVRRIAMLGDMRELGPHSDDAHDRIGLLAAELQIDVVVGIGVDGARIADAAARAGRDVHVVDDAVDAPAFALTLVEPGDAILVKASRALGLQRVADALLETPRAAS